MNIKSIIGSFLKGALKAVPIVGNVATELIDQKEQATEHAPKGKIDIPRIIGYIIVGIIVFSVILGKLSIEDAKTLINKISSFGFFSF
jgi:nucleoside diphosphate kinase